MDIYQLFDIYQLSDIYIDHRVLHMRSLETIFRCLYLYYASKSFAKFRYQCYRGRPSKMSSKRDANNTSAPLSARQLSARGFGSKIRKSHIHFIEEQSTIGSSQSGDDESTLESGSMVGGLGNLADSKPYMSPADEQVMHVMRGRESLLDELRSKPSYKKQGPFLYYVHLLYDESYC